MFDVGALIFKIQTAGAQVFQKDMAQADQAIRKVEGSAKAAKPALEEQGNKTEELGRKSRKASEEQNKQKKATEDQVQAAKTLSLALIAAGAAVTALVGLSVAKYTSFDAQMSNVRAATMATAEEQKALGEAALEAGADTAYSANEAAAAQEELAKAGLSVTEVVNGGLTGALSLAAAGQLQVARSAEIMATTLKQYKLPAEDAAHVSDLLAAGAGKAQGSVEDLALALTYVGPVAAGLGIGIEETAGTLGYLAEQGLLGEKAGTSLRGVIMSLTAPSAIATRTMEQYGIEIFDSAGNMKSLADVSQILSTRLGGLTEAERSAALGRIFGNEQITAARLLYDGGGKAIEEWTDKVNDSGYAAEQAAMRQDNLAGDVEKLGGAFDTAFIKTGAGANDVLRDMVQIVTALVDWYGEWPTELQTTTLVLGVLTGAILLASGAAVGMTARFSELRVQLEKNNISMGKTAAIGGAVGLALAGVITVVALLAAKHAEARAKAEAYSDTLEEGTNRVTAATRDLVKENLAAREAMLWWEQSSAYDAAEKLGISLDLVTDAALDDASALAELQRQVEAAGEEHRSSQDDYEAYESWVRTLTDAVAGEAGSLQEARRQAEQKQSADQKSAETSQTAAAAYLEAADGAADLNSELRKLIDAVNEANGVGQDAVTTNAAYQEGLANIAKQVEESGTSLNQSTEAGSANAAMLAKVAADAQKAAEAQLELDQQTMSGTAAAEKYAETLAAQRQEFIDSAVAAGYNREEVEALAEQIFKLPSEKEIALLADTLPAREAINGVIQDYQGRTITLSIGAQGQQTYSRDGGRTTYEADGSVRYAADGLLSRQDAQIRAAGSYVVWAEDETHGESFVPHAESKRARAEAIMAETASIFGGVYIPAGAVGYANGSPVPGSAPAGSTRVVIGTRGGIDLLDYIDVRVEEPTRKIISALRGS